MAQATGVPLDGTQDTLPILDHYLDGVLEGETPRQEVLALVAPTAGAYFGEVVRQHLGDGTWVDGDLGPGDLPGELRLHLLGGALRLRPVEAAREAILKAKQPGAPAVLEPRADLREAADAALEAFGEVREGDYFRLSVRFDALLQAYAHVERALRTRSANGHGGPPSPSGPSGPKAS